MKHFTFLLFLAACLSIIAVSCNSRAQIQDPWPEITSETKPWTRWWWLGSDVDSENITSLMEQYASAGFGGVEITPIYGVIGREDQTLEFLSDAWMEMLHTTVSEAAKQGMGVDMNLGTGWPFGGPQIKPAQAASGLILKTYELSENEALEEKIGPGKSGQQEEGVILEALMGYSVNGSILDLTAHVTEDGTLNWSSGEGQWELVALFCGKTRQQVKRAAPGGEGYTMDHFSSTALNTYLKRFEDAFGGKPGIRSFFNDSYEVYNASWTPGLLDEFRQRRGYDLREYLREFSGAGYPDTISRIKSDYRLTLSELLLENFTRPWTAWSHQYGGLTRNQAHGSPGNLLDLYAAVDIPECEIFGHRTFAIPGMRINEDDSRNVEPNPMMLKLATSAAHITGKAKISNETFTWLGEHFKVALSQCKPEVEEAFLAGINHVFYHGTSYSPAEAAWPGWLFYASVNFNPSNSFWAHLPGLNQYITRCQSILQSGKPDNEILVYWPVSDIWNNPDGLEMQLSVHNIQEWLTYPGIERMSEQGYKYDFISDALLQDVESDHGHFIPRNGANPYEVLVVPACEFMPLATLKHILSLAADGGLVVFEEIPGDVPGFGDLALRKNEFNSLLDSLTFRKTGETLAECSFGDGTILLGSDVAEALEYAGIKGEQIGETGLKYTRRSVEGGKYYYLVNHTSTPIDTLVTLKTRAKAVLIMDPQDGDCGMAYLEKGASQTRVRVQLRSGESLFLRTLESGAFKAGPWVYEGDRHEPIELVGSWKLTFNSGGPTLPASRVLDRPVPWTDLDNQEMVNFSGLATYSLKFQGPDQSAENYMLDLGSVHESARVKLNGTDLGIVWSIPFEVEAGPYLKEGENLLEIEVANLMANRIRFMDREGITWRIFHEINFVNIAYAPFDASGWIPEKSGLSGPVTLIPVN